jgi:hypothetical protein
VTGILPRLARAALLAAASCTVLSCEWAGGKKVPKATVIRFPKAGASDGTRRDPKLSGTILMVNAEGNFVVVDSGVWMPPEAGSALKCMRDGVETGVVAVGRERRGSHVVADIVTGQPRKGDQVFH